MPFVFLTHASIRRNSIEIAIGKVIKSQEVVYPSHHIRAKNFFYLYFLLSVITLVQLNFQ